MKKTFLILALALATLSSCSNDDEGNKPEIPSLGAILQPAVGGPNQPNQVYVDLSTSKSDAIPRGSWDFGFSTGAEYQ